MNDDRNFQSHKQVFIELLRLQLPVQLASKYLAIHDATAHKYLSNLQKEGWSEEVSAPRKSRQLMLALYAKIVQSDFKVDQRLSIDRLRELLRDFLEVDKIVEILIYSCKYLRPFEEVSFSSEVPMAYQRFIRDIFGIPTDPDDNGQYYWLQYLRMINNCELQPAGNMFGIIDQIMQRYSTDVKNNLAPVYTEEVCRLIDEKILTSLDKELLEIVRLYYGFDDEPMSSKNIAQLFGVSQTTINQRQQHCKGLLRSCKNLIYGEKLSWKYLVTQVEEAVQAESDKFLDELQRCYTLIQRLGEGTKLSKNKHRISQFDISARLQNCLNKMHIIYFEELSENYETDLLKQRDFGVTTLNELKDILQNFGIEFRTRIKIK